VYNVWANAKLVGLQSPVIVSLLGPYRIFVYFYAS